MLLETRDIGGKPSVVLVPTPEEARLLDRYLGDCGQGPIALSGCLTMSDVYGQVYIALWNPDFNPGMTATKE